MGSISGISCRILLRRRHADGEYHIEGGVWSTDGTDDSFFVAVDGTMSGSGRWDVAHVTYGADYVNTYQMNDPTSLLPDSRPAYGRGVPSGKTAPAWTRSPSSRFHLFLTPDCGSGWYEAEDAVVQGMSVENRYIHVPEGNGSFWSPTDAYSANILYHCEPRWAVPHQRSGSGALQLE